MLLFGYYLFMKAYRIGHSLPDPVFFSYPVSGMWHQPHAALSPTGKLQKSFFLPSGHFCQSALSDVPDCKDVIWLSFLQNDPLEPDRKCRYNPFDLRFDPIYSLSQSGNLPIKDCFSILPMIKYKIYFLVYSSFEKGRKL